MLRQNDKALNPIQEWGCAFCSLLYLLEKVTNATFTADYIIKLWFRNYTEGDIDIESSMDNWQGVITDCTDDLKYLGHFPPDYIPAENEYEILLFKRPDGYKHFVVGDGKGGVEWDPWENSRSVKEGEIISKRIFRRK